MSDTTQGQDSVSDNDLFRDAIESTTLEKFENPEPPKADVKPPEKIEPKPDVKEPEPAVPPGRFREESEARRRAEQERDVLRGRLEAFERQQKPQQQQPTKVDIFDNPSGFVRQEVEPFLKSFQEQLQETREQMSLDNAVSRHGEEVVTAARTALVAGIRGGDPSMKAILDRALQSPDPWGVITKAHRERDTMTRIGGDLEAYNKSVLEKALEDPEYRKRVIERAQADARAGGQVINRPAQSKVPNVPSLANVGAGGGDEQVQEPSDDQLFRQVVSAKRR